MPLRPRRLTAIDLLRLARRRWVVVLLFGLAGLAATIVFYRNATRWYEAEILIVPKRSPQMGSGLGLLGGLGFGLAAKYSDTDRIDAILRSRSVTDEIIDRFDLMSRYEVGSLEQARKRLWSACSTDVRKKQKVVGLRCEDEDARVACDMANTFGQLADGGLRRVARSSTREERSFVGARVAQAERDLDDSSRAIRTFQETHGIVDLPVQSKAVISGLAALEGDVLSQRLELSYASGFSSDREVSIVRIQEKIGAISAELRAMESRRVADPLDREPGPPRGTSFPPALEVPELRAELEALLREHQIRETLFRMLAERQEALRVEQSGDVSSFVVFDRAVLPSQHIRPTLRILPPGFLAGLLLGVLFISTRSGSTASADI